MPPTLFGSSEVLRLTLEMDIRRVIADRSQESQEFPGVIGVHPADGGSREVAVEVRTRGRFRLQEHICTFPPLRLDFPASEKTGTVFDGQDKVKLVTHCHDRNSFEQNVLEEYLAYRLLNLLTPVSFRVRLAEITYRDSRGAREPLTRMGFLLESEEEMAARLEGMALDIPGARATAFEPRYMGLMFLFQYMIGNIDWSTANTQNLQVIRVDSDHYAVPYDFDWSGLVDAPYAGPSPLTERLHGSVRERLYRGVCWEAIDYSETFTRFQEQRDAILAAPGEIPRLSPANVRNARDYLEEFFDFIGRPDRAEADLRRMCRAPAGREEGSAHLHGYSPSILIPFASKRSSMNRSYEDQLVVLR